MKKYLMFLSAAGVLVLSSCLKDKNVSDRVYGINGVEDIKTIEITQAPSRVLSFDVSSELQTISIFRLNLNTNHLPGSDTKVTLAIDQDALDAFNTENETEYGLLPEDIYELVGGLTQTIAQGDNSVNVQIKLKSEDLLDGPYALPLKIVSTDKSDLALSANYQSIVVILGAKNKYDGLYKIKIRTTGWSAYGIADNATYEYPEEYAFITVSATANEGSCTYRGDFLVPGFTSAGGPTAFGAAEPLFTFDPETDKLVSVTNLLPDDGRGRTFAINPAVTDSRFDPATKSIYMSFYMTQNSRPNMYFYDTLTYVGPR